MNKIIGKINALILSALMIVSGTAAVGVRLRERTDVSGAARKGGRGAGAGL